MIWLGGTRRRIMEQLVDADGPVRVMDLASSLDMRHPTIIAHLAKLGEAGLVQETRARPAFHALWVEPRHGLLEEWHSVTPIDWRFPLITRIPDVPAQRFLLEWFDRAQARGLLPLQKSLFEDMEKRPPTLHMVVYGSCARGDAREKSDIDILLHTDRRWAGIDKLIDLGYDISLAGPRNLSARPVTRDDMETLPTDLVKNIANDGRTVWCNDPDAAPLESMLPSRFDA